MTPRWIFYGAAVGMLFWMYLIGHGNSPDRAVLFFEAVIIALLLVVAGNTWPEKKG